MADSRYRSQGGWTMAIKALWLVEHGCGDDEVHDLSGKRPSERAGYARWLRGKDQAIDNESWLAERRAEEAIAVRTWERRAAMCDLDGSDKAIPWGAQVRYRLLTAAHDYHVTGSRMSNDEFADRFEV